MKDKKKPTYNGKDKSEDPAALLKKENIRLVYESRELEKKLIDSLKREQFLTGLFHNAVGRLNKSQEIAHLGSWELDLKNDQLTWSDEVYRIFGLEPQEFKATYEAFLESVHPDDRHLVNDAYQDSVRAGKNTYEIEHRIIRKSDGEIRIVYEKCEHTMDESGNLILSIGMVNDITESKRSEKVLEHEIMERKRSEAELRKLNLDLQKLRRSNYELEQFAYVSSHDLQEPLRQINSFTSLLAKSLSEKLDSKQNQYMQFITEGSQQMSNVIHDLLTFSRVGRDEEKFKSTSLNEVLINTLSILKITINDSDASITYDELPVLKVVPTQITQLFQNLLTNAIKFRNSGVRPQIHIGARRDVKNWLFWVKDNGIGIEQQYFEKIFRIFQRLHARGESGVCNYIKTANRQSNNTYY